MNNNINAYAKITSSRPSKVGFNRPYFLIDASKTPIGRVATESARILMGKNRADFSPDVDMGGIVVIINAKQQVLTGKKAERKVYFRYGRQLGSLKSRSFEEQVAKDFKFPIYTAIKKMLPRNRHQDLRANNRVHIFAEGHDIKFPMIEVQMNYKMALYPDFANTSVNTPSVMKVETKVEAPKKVVEPNAVKVINSNDDLTKIEGIGPKAAEVFVNAGINTFSLLASTATDKMKELLANAEAKVQHLDPTTWAAQSQLAADGKWEELQVMQDELNGGKAE
jgi:ribosomal protein L13